MNLFFILYAVVGFFSEASKPFELIYLLDLFYILLNVLKLEELNLWFRRIIFFVICAIQTGFWEAAFPKRENTCHKHLL